MTAPVAASPRPRERAASGRSRPGIFRRGALAGLRAPELAGLETPFYLYDLDVVEGQARTLRAVLPARFDVAYAVKANPALAVVAFLGGLGLGADVASAGELELVARAGIPPGDTIFTGPGKRDPEIAAAIAAGVRAVTVESPGELERVAGAARQLGRRARIMLRLATGGGPGSGVYAVGAVETGAGDSHELSGKFGMDPDDLRRTARAVARTPEVELVGVHAFGASNVREAEALAQHVAQTVEFAGALFRELDLPLRLVDAGGGLGIPYRADEHSLDIGRLGRRLAALDRAWRRRSELRAMRVVLEPGRFLVGPAGAYVARVLDVKDVGGRRVLVTDGGIHHALRPALVGHAHRLELARSRARMREGARPAATRPAIVAGPLCTSLDVLGELGVHSPEPKPGDLIALLDVGAYGFTESMALFLSHPTPAEHAVRGRRLETIRPSRPPSDWLAAQRIPAW